jgi:hypothetical protein
MQVLSQIFSKEAALASNREQGRWLKSCYREQLVKMLPPYDDITTADRITANRKMAAWIAK